jgi:hypothetical protein
MGRRLSLVYLLVYSFIYSFSYSFIYASLGAHLRSQWILCPSAWRQAPSVCQSAVRWSMGASYPYSEYRYPYSEYRYPYSEYCYPYLHCRHLRSARAPSAGQWALSSDGATPSGRRNRHDPANRIVYCCSVPNLRSLGLPEGSAFSGLGAADAAGWADHCLGGRTAASADASEGSALDGERLADRVLPSSVPSFVVSAPFFGFTVHYFFGQFSAAFDSHRV